MPSTSANFADWRTLSTLEIWEIAVLMHGVDPRALADVVVRDPHNPTSFHGIPLDTSWEEKMLLSAARVEGQLCELENNIAPDNHTHISVAKLIPWLRMNNHIDLADSLASATSLSKTEAKNGTAKRWTADLVEQARLHRDQHGTAATAELYGVTASRIRQVLAKKKPSQPAANTWFR